MRRSFVGFRTVIFGMLLAGGVFALYRWVDAEPTDTVDWKNLVAVSKYEVPASAVTSVKSQQKLQAITQEMSVAYSSNIGLVITDLSNGASAGTNADAQFVSASIYKLFVAYDVYKKIDQGTISYSDKLTAYGTARTIGQCLGDMLTVSDNTCGIALGKLCNWASLDAVLAAEGYAHTVLNNYNEKGIIVKDKLTSASDVAHLLTKLYKGTLLSDDSSASFLQHLKGDSIDYMLPSGLSAGTIVAHKVGFLGEYQHDAGIIYGSKKDMLVVMLTKGWTTTPEAKATAAFTSLGEKIELYRENT